MGFHPVAVVGKLFQKWERDSTKGDSIHTKYTKHKNYKKTQNTQNRK